jgi:hypothetical protein
VHYARNGRLLPALRGKWAALTGLPGVLESRRAVQAGARGDVRALEGMMERNWMALKRREKGVRA